MTLIEQSAMYLDGRDSLDIIVKNNSKKSKRTIRVLK